VSNVYLLYVSIAGLGLGTVGLNYKTGIIPVSRHADMVGCVLHSAGLDVAAP